jgi:hypothetical protein
MPDRPPETTGPSDDPGIIYVQLDRNVSGQVKPQADAARFARLTRAQLEQIADAARETGRALLARLRDVDTVPSKVKLEFGLSAGGEAGIPFVTKGTLEAQFKVSLEWSPSGGASGGRP